MDNSSDYEFDSSPEGEYTVFETFRTHQVPKDMQEFVPHFKPLGTVKRLQGAVELICIYGNDSDDEGIPLDELESVNFESFTRKNRLKARQIASTKRPEDTFSLDPLKGPSNHILVGLLNDIKEESNANDTTLEIHQVEAESEKENLPVVHNERNFKKPYAVTTLKKREDITYKLNVKSELRGSQIDLTSIAPSPHTNHKRRLELKCSRNAVRTLNSQITQMRDPLDSMKCKPGQLIALKP